MVLRTEAPAHEGRLSPLPNTLKSWMLAERKRTNSYARASLAAVYTLIGARMVRPVSLGAAGRKLKHLWHCIAAPLGLVPIFNRRLPTNALRCCEHEA